MPHLPFHLTGRRLLTIALAVVVVLVIAGFALRRIADAPSAADETPTQDVRATPALVARGAYLAAAGDCASCHTVDKRKPFAGGFPMKLPFGTIYGSNITPDPNAGIGRWSDAQFIAAMTRGISSNGRHLYPAMPYTSYTKMSVPDILAIKAYLFSLRPIAEPTPRSTIGFPFNQTWAIAYWNLLFNSKRRFEPDPARSAVVNRGAYLVEGAGHCGGCHTPRNLLYAESSGKFLAGAVVDGARAYNITGDPATGIGAWSSQDLVDYMRTGHAAGRGVAGTAMALVVEKSLSHLTDDDLQAIAVYLRQTPGKPSAVVVARHPPAATNRVPDDEPEGRLLYAGTCAGCHGGIGQGRLPIPLLGYRSVNDPEGLNALVAVINGVDVTTRADRIRMPAFGHAYSDAEIAAMVRYLTASFGDVRSRVRREDVAAHRLSR